MNSIQFLSIFLAQMEPSGPGIFIQIAPFILLMVGFWFLLILPQRKKQKEHEKMITEIKVGDKVITSGGICGHVTMVKKDRFQIKVDDNCRMDVIKSYVAMREPTEK